MIARLCLFIAPLTPLEQGSGSTTAQPRKIAPLSIILISVDTLRADRLSCYSRNARKTPRIDRLVQGGTLFSQVSSQVPLTLPSHASMLTSRYPFAIGVRDNGDRLAPGSATLATILKSHGYHTAAFVGSFVLDRRFGLAQGFDTYDGPAESQNAKSNDIGDVKRSGSDVVRDATGWLKSHSNQPFFLFLHIYDLHTPYNLSIEEKTKYGEGYNGELGYIDDVIGTFWSFLVEQRLVDQALVVFTSDHGESLGDHGESTHGFFIYQSTLHVPLIVHWPGNIRLLPDRVDSAVSLVDVVPTILKAARIPLAPSLQGRSLVVASESDSDVYSESIYPHKHFDAGALASLRRGRYKYIDAPKPEFFDLQEDPGEVNNVYAANKDLATAYRERVNRIRQLGQQQVQKDTTLSPDAIEKLQALGYLTGSVSAHTSSQLQADPKDKLLDYEQYGHALELASRGHLPEANYLLEELLRKDCNLLDVRLSLGLNQQRVGNDREALDLFRQVLVADPTNAIAHFDEGLSYYNLLKFAEAEKELGAALLLSPDYMKAEELLANTLVHKRDYDKARAQFNHILLTNPDDYEAQYNLGVLATLRNDWEDGVKHLRAALAINPGSAEAHNTLGSIHFREEELESAETEFKEAIRLKPDYAWAHYNLGLVYRQRKEWEAARSEFSNALVADPEFRAARDALTGLEHSQ